jgi:glycerophosphoryl diester phosphodiesterase
MKRLLFVLLALTMVIVIYYGSYYLVSPDAAGGSILEDLNIPHPTVVAHRGASVVAPESTRPAYEIARDLGADYLEADLQRTADGHIVVFHDPALLRTSNVAEVYPDRVGDPVGKFTLEELRRLDYGSWFNDRFPGHAREEYEGLQILTLKELITLAKSGKHNPGLILETKYPYNFPGIEEEIISILQDEDWLEQQEPFARTIFFSFSVGSLEKFQSMAPGVPRLLLITDTMISRRSWAVWLDRGEAVADGLGPKGFMAWPWHIAAAHAAGLFVFPYTVNRLWQVQVLARFQAAGYITDRPEVVLGFLDRVNILNTAN